MKLLKIKIIVLLSAVSLAGAAEKLTFCKALNKIIESSDKEFSDIKLSEIQGESYVTKYKTSVEIEGASDCFLEILLGPLTYKAEFGEFSSVESAKSKISDLTGQLKQCYKNIDFVSYEGNIIKSYSTDLIKKADKGFRYYKAGFRINKYGNTYDLSFEYKAAETSGYGANKKLEPVYADFYYIDNQQDYSQFSTDIRKLINEGKNVFSNIKGEEIPADFALFKNFSTKYKPSGFSDCYIEDRGLDIVFYIIPLGSGMGKDETVKLRNDYFNKIKSALGSNYAYNLSSDQFLLSFVEKNKPQQTVVKLLVEYKSGSYETSILIAADR